MWPRSRQMPKWQIHVNRCEAFRHSSVHFRDTPVETNKRAASKDTGHQQYFATTPNEGALLDVCSVAIRIRFGRVETTTAYPFQVACQVKQGLRTAPGESQATSSRRKICEILQECHHARGRNQHGAEPGNRSWRQLGTLSPRKTKLSCTPEATQTRDA